MPTSREVRKILDSKLPNLEMGYESLWAGYQLLKRHSIPIHIQMSTCSLASKVQIEDDNIDT